MPREVEIRGMKYSIGKLTPMQSWHVTRRLLPALVAFASGMKQSVTAADGKLDHDKLTEVLSGGAELGGMIDALGPVADILAKMPDADSEVVIYICLGAVQREQSGGWAKIINGDRLMFQDITMPEMIRMTIEVVNENLGDFLPALRATT